MIYQEKKKGSQIALEVIYLEQQQIDLFYVGHVKRTAKFVVIEKL